MRENHIEDLYEICGEIVSWFGLYERVLLLGKDTC